MCGIIGYIGDKNVVEILIEGLKKMEYRGYDSWGIGIQTENKISIIKKEGKISNVDPGTNNFPKSNLGIGHTRWATTGRVSDRNAHPFTDQTNQFAVVHNGIIENYLELKEELRNQGVQFSSDTDSEVIVHLIAKNYTGDLKDTVLKTIKKLQGAYSFCVVQNDSQEIIGARNGSPLVIGKGKKENFFASDVSAIIEHTREAIYLNDFQIARITKDKVEVFDFQGQEKPLDVREVNWTLEKAQKQGYKHFMLKEIFEQPEVIRETLKVPINVGRNFSRIIVVACGTASYASLVGKYLIEEVAKTPVIYEIASEFRYKENLLSKNDQVIVISQSGETADTLAAVRLAKEKGAKTLGIVNVVDSTIAREVDERIYTRAGPEIGVASTKAFISQLIIMYKLAFYLAGKEFDSRGTEIESKIKEVLAKSEEIKKLAQKYYLYQNFLYIGRNRNFPLALEGALKLKEISYIHAEAYPAGELKHGPIALVSEEMPTLAICPRDSVYAKTFSNIEEIKAREGKVITIATEDDQEIKKVSDDVIYIPKAEEILYPLLCTIPLQLFAYYIAECRGCDIDHPRNLAKAVSVE